MWETVIQAKETHSRRQQWKLKPFNFSLFATDLDIILMWVLQGAEKNILYFQRFSNLFIHKLVYNSWIFWMQYIHNGEKAPQRRKKRRKSSTKEKMLCKCPNTYKDWLPLLDWNYGRKMTVVFQKTVHNLSCDTWWNYAGFKVVQLIHDIFGGFLLWYVVSCYCIFLFFLFFFIIIGLFLSLNIMLPKWDHWLVTFLHFHY